MRTTIIATSLALALAMACATPSAAGKAGAPTIAAAPHGQDHAPAAPLLQEWENYLTGNDTTADDFMLLPESGAQPYASAALIPDHLATTAQAAATKRARVAVPASDSSPVPEPGAASLMLIGLVLLALVAHDDTDQKFTR